MAERAHKLPAIQFYPGDWRKDVGVQSLTFHDRGVWFEMLMLMHESEMRGMLVLNGQVMSEDALARVLGLDKQTLTTTLTELLTSGVASRDPESGAIMSRRMVRDEKLRQVRAEAGSKGGNPVLLKQKSTTGDKQSSTPSSSSSVSSSIPKDKAQAPFVLPDWIDPEDWAAYMDTRKKRRAAETPRALNAVIKQLDAFRARGHTVSAILGNSIRSGWTDVYEPKGEGNGRGNGFQTKTGQSLDAASAALAEISRREASGYYEGFGEADGTPAGEDGPQRLLGSG